MTAVIATCAVAATEAQAQSQPPAPRESVVINEQSLFGDVFSGQTLNVVDVREQVTAGAAATGNSLYGAVENDSLSLVSDQTVQGDVRAETDLILGGETEGVVNASTQAAANALTAGAYDAALGVDARQQHDGGEVFARSTIDGGTARLLEGGRVSATAASNTVVMGGENAIVTGSVEQSSSAMVRAHNYAATQYIPAEAEFSSQAMGNAVAVTTTSASHQNLALRQSATGPWIEAGTSANAGNAWDLAGRAHAAANHAALYNEGGSLLVQADQTSTATVRAESIVTSYDYGAGLSQAQASGNSLTAANHDIYLEIDSTQFNSGGVQAQAVFSGAQGYDVYVGAEAVGNSVTGYVCSDCPGVINARNNQVNDGGISATATVSAPGGSRAVITGTQAVGNSATFYASRPGR